jgi:tetratricopeptide (TPR) repeat protein
MKTVKYEVYRGELKYLHETGNRHYLKGEYRKAIGYYKRMLRLIPSHAEGHVALGNAYVALGQMKLAMRHYQLAKQHKPQLARLVRPYKAYALTYRKKDTRHPLTALQMALVMAKSGRLEKLKDFLGSIRDLTGWIDNQKKVQSPGNQAVSRQLIDLSRLGKLKGCLSCQVFAGLWLLDEVTQDAVPAVQQAISLATNPAHKARLVYRLGLFYERSGQRVAAVNTYLLMPNDPRIRARLR